MTKQASRNNKISTIFTRLTPFSCWFMIKQLRSVSYRRKQLKWIANLQGNPAGQGFELAPSVKVHKQVAPKISIFDR